MVVINDLYKTEITPSKYKLSWSEYSLFQPMRGSEVLPFIESETITITVKLTDFKGNPITNKEATIKCQSGVFIKNNDLVKQYTGTTNSSGVFTVSYKTKRIEVDTLYCNEASVMVDGSDTGWIERGYITNTSQFINRCKTKHHSDNSLKYRKYKDITEIRGSITPNESISPGVICTVPPIICASETTRRLQQGTGAYKYMSSITNKGEICCQRYNNTGTDLSTISSGYWLNCYHTFNSGEGIPLYSDLRYYLAPEDDRPTEFFSYDNNSKITFHNVYGYNRWDCYIDEYLPKQYLFFPLEISGKLHIDCEIKGTSWELGLYNAITPSDNYIKFSPKNCRVLVYGISSTVTGFTGANPSNTDYCNIQIYIQPSKVTARLIINNTTIGTHTMNNSIALDGKYYLVLSTTSTYNEIHKLEVK